MDKQVKLSPPQYTYSNFIKHSIGNDPCVRVLDLQETPHGDYLQIINVDERRKAAALATILKRRKTFGNVKIRIEVRHCGRVVEPVTEIRSILRLFEAALDTNRWFEFVESKQVFFGLKPIFPVFKKDVIQFFNDDLSDLYANFNGVVADVFREVLREKIGEDDINPSTAKSRC